MPIYPFIKIGRKIPLSPFIQAYPFIRDLRVGTLNLKKEILVASVQEENTNQDEMSQTFINLM